ncbi:hypothetical protein VSS74_31410, partial [Conexibacter stalactiti]
MRRSQTLITLLIALALIAAPVAASTLDHRPSSAPIAQHPAQLSPAPWATLLTPPLAPGIPSADSAAAVARAAAA